MSATEFPVRVQPTEYVVTAAPETMHPDNASMFRLTVSWRGGDTWAICDRYDRVRTHRGDWLWEPQPSSRTPSFLKRTRWTLAAALTEAVKLAPTLTCNGMTIADAVRREAQRGVSA